MPTINYCDYTNGNDSTGDGSRTNPYKTITKASTGLIGGDEVRCAKSADPTDLSGTLTWTNGSTSVATSVDLTGVLAANDFIRKKVLNAADYDVWWEIASINSTTITLAATFRGYSESGSIGQKLGVTDTGTAAASTTQVQVVSASGTNASSRITISGGWDLAPNPAVQIGTTWFFQSGANRYGYGIYSSAKNYISFEKMGVLRYYYGIGIVSSGNSIYFNNIHSLGFGYAGIGIITATARFIKILNTIAMSAVASCYGFLTYGTGYYIDGCIIVNCQWGVWSQAVNISLYNCVFKEVVTCSLQGTSSGGIVAVNCNFNGGKFGVYTGSSWIYNPSNLSSNNIVISGTVDPLFSYEYILPIVYVKTSTEDFTITSGGIGEKNTSESRTGSCLKITPSSTVAYHVQEFVFPADADTARTLKFYAKMSADFDGSADAAIFFMGTKITDWTSLNLTTDYAQYSIVADADDTPLSGVYVLRIRVKKGTTGSIYVDDLSFT